MYDNFVKIIKYKFDEWSFYFISPVNLKFIVLFIDMILNKFTYRLCDLILKR